LVSDTNYSAEENEWAFCSLWTKKTEFRCATALVNPRLKEDYFFNRAAISDGCEIPYEQIAKIFWDVEMDCYVYFFGSSPPDGFSLADSMYVLSSTTDPNPYGAKVPIVTETADTITWTDIFCKSFSVPEWKHEVERIIKESTRKLDLLLAYNIENRPVGCAALFTKSGITALYCLGTVPMQRNKGIAKSILKFAKTFAKQKHDSPTLFLQTLGSENLLDLYKSAGFKIAYTKVIYKIPRLT
jgi:GNAT superfamily N-acetyltransferase